MKYSLSDLLTAFEHIDPDVKTNGWSYPNNVKRYYGSYEEIKEKDDKFYSRVRLHTTLTKSPKKNKYIASSYTIKGDSEDEVKTTCENFIKNLSKYFNLQTKTGMYKYEEEEKCYYIVMKNNLKHPSLIIKVDTLEDVKYITDNNFVLNDRSGQDKKTKYISIALGRDKLENLLMKTEDKLFFKDGDVLNFCRSNLTSLPRLVIEEKEKVYPEKEDAKEEEKEEEEEEVEKVYPERIEKKKEHWLDLITILAKRSEKNKKMAKCNRCGREFIYTPSLAQRHLNTTTCKNKNS